MRFVSIFWPPQVSDLLCLPCFFHVFHVSKKSPFWMTFDLPKSWKSMLFDLLICCVFLFLSCFDFLKTLKTPHTFGLNGGSCFSHSFWKIMICPVCLNSVFLSFQSSLVWFWSVLGTSKIDLDPPQPFILRNREGGFGKNTTFQNKLDVQKKH